MKPRPPTLRTKRRYVLFSVQPVSAAFNGKELYYAVSEAASSLYGDRGAAEIQAAVTSCAAGYAIIRCARGTEGSLQIAAATIISVSGIRVALHPLAVSGTIRALRRRMRPISLPEDGGTCEIGGKSFRIAVDHGQKVDLIGNGNKSQDTLYFILDDLEGI